MRSNVSEQDQLAAMLECSTAAIAKGLTLG
jgi:hypothetical protein